jgi:hypothetical protein
MQIELRQDTTTSATDIRLMGVTPRSEKRNSTVHWLLMLWLAMTASGALTTGLLRAGSVDAVVVKTSLVAHEALGTAIAALAALYVFYRGVARRTWRAGLIAGVLVCGWPAARTFAPLWSAIHAIAAAFSAAAIVDRIPVRTNTAAVWQAVAAQLAVTAVLIQVAVGALLRHQLITLPWHLLFGGAAVLLLLIAAVPTTQSAASTPGEKRIARSAIASIIAQVVLGAAIFVMILVGVDRLDVWLSVTVAHVVMGSVTLVATSALAQAHRRTSTAV